MAIIQSFDDHEHVVCDGAEHESHQVLKPLMYDAHGTLHGECLKHRIHNEQCAAWNRWSQEPSYLGQTREDFHAYVKAQGDQAVRDWKASNQADPLRAACLDLFGELISTLVIHGSSPQVTNTREVADLLNASCPTKSQKTQRKKTKDQNQKRESSVLSPTHESSNESRSFIKRHRTLSGSSVTAHTSVRQQDGSIHGAANTAQSLSPEPSRQGNLRRLSGRHFMSRTTPARDNSPQVDISMSGVPRPGPTDQSRTPTSNRPNTEDNEMAPIAKDKRINSIILAKFINALLTLAGNRGVSKAKSSLTIADFDSAEKHDEYIQGLTLSADAMARLRRNTAPAQDASSPIPAIVASDEGSTIYPVTAIGLVDMVLDLAEAAGVQSTIGLLKCAGFWDQALDQNYVNTLLLYLGTSMDIKRSRQGQVEGQQGSSTE